MAAAMTENKNTFLSVIVKKYAVEIYKIWIRTIPVDKTDLRRSGSSVDRRRC